MPKPYASRAKNTKQRAYRRGILAEYAAMVLLAAKGYKLLARRFKTPFGEVDIICKRRKELIFIEVKAYRGARDLSMISPRQQHRWQQAAAYYLAKHPNFGNLTVRFDGVLVRGSLWPRHVLNILTW